MLDFLNKDIFDVNCDLWVVPVSTEGTISHSFHVGIEKLSNSNIEWEKKKYSLGDVEIYSFSQGKKIKHIALVCTVDRNQGAYYAIRLIGKRLADKIFQIGNIREIATPLLGTGAGKLHPAFSLNIMRSAFYETAGTEAISLTFCSLDRKAPYIFERNDLHTDIPSAQQVIMAEASHIKENEIIKKIRFEKDFYFGLAAIKFNEYLEFNTTHPNFYTNLAEEFNKSSLTFKEFYNNITSTEQQSFTELCGELISYIDYHAYRKNIWNKYPDKRILARSAVRQNNWFLNLIKYKQTKNINSLSSSIKNAFIFLLSPATSLTMLSDNHRIKVFEELFSSKYQGEESLNQLFSFFKSLEVRPLNEINTGALYSRILYLPFIKPIWNDDIKIKTTLEQNLTDTDLTLASTLIEECLKNKYKKLDLGNCGLTNLTIVPELFECVHLEELTLSNEWSEYIDGKWRKISSKNNGRRNNIQSFPEDISKLTELKVLICGGDWRSLGDKFENEWKINSFTPITKLKKLEHLNLSNNKLLNLKGLNKLSNLKIVHLNNNEISKVEVLDNLKGLEELYLSNNKIKTVTFLSRLPKIKTIDLHSNQIKILKPLINVITNIGIVNDKWRINTLSIARNPLEQPPMEIVNIGKEAVLALFKDIEDRGKYINKDIKIILVGNSEVGKTTLVKYLDNEKDIEKPHLPTLWMVEKTIKSKYRIATIGDECLLHIFDFGGHDYFHDTHHLFFSTNTIYLLLWDKETNSLNLRKSLQQTEEGIEIEIETQDYPIKYWLDSVKFYTKDIETDNIEPGIKRENTYNSSLLLIQNKVSNASAIFPVYNKTLTDNYPFIYDIINISIKQPKRNTDHFDNLFSEILNSMNIIGANLPKFYEPIKNNIPSYVGKPIITIQEFLSYCNKILRAPITEDQCRRLVKYLVQIGVLLYSDKNKEEKVYIDKEWIIKSIHNILKNLKDSKGEFDRNYVISILKVDNNTVDDLLLMMQEFKMIFKHPYSDLFIAPLYLPKLPDGKIKLFLNDKLIPYRRFEYNGFIHKSVILSIFQKFSSQIPIDNNNEIFYYWKDGLVIKDSGTEEIVMIKFHLGNEEGNACIDIYELSNTKKHLFTEEVIKYIREVNLGFDIEEMVTLNGIDFISKKVLEKNAAVGKYTFSEKKLSDFNNTKKEEKYFKLKDYESFIDQPIKKKKVVISYSKKDLAQVHTLIRFLQPLIDNDLIEQPWYCTIFNPADEWDTKIKSKFEEADIVFFMISEYFYSTKYIVDNEITIAINRYDEGDEIKIIPVILDFYDWGRKGKYDLRRFSSLPYQAKPISDFGNPKIAWNTITSSVKAMIEKDLDPGKKEIISRSLQEIYERQVEGKLDNNT
ncbi:leucine-rich repeat domain-containing protein [Flavobacterium sp. UBA7682]|uniref:leucine-rich repeat domain-containing protein n=1 Tax=Flavobacterium sp. UBA7682 TaxID=1946560 RepID=UPI0025BC7BD0|nr:leucine-rich repeat domain-containing protein [Flavobacterium sp. UBA7682]